jgi:large subunit ribosomal protein L25
VATVDVALEIQGEPVGLRDGGQLKQLARTVNITCPDYRIPRTIVVRVGSLKVGDSVVAGALTTDDTITVNTPADTVLVELINPKKSAG